MKSKVLKYLIPSLMVLILGCTQSFYSKEQAEKYLFTIHEKFNEKDFLWMYNDFSSGFRAEVSEANFIAAIEQVRLILGSAKKADFVDSWRAKKISGEPLEVYRFSTKYDNGSGIEIIQIELDESSGKPKLFRYEINSDEVMRHMLKNSK